MKPFNREQFFVLRKVQGALLLRTAMHWVIGVLFLGFGAIVWHMVTGASEGFLSSANYVWSNYQVGFITAVVVFPFLIIDMLWFSNRFAGPMVRIQNAMRRLASGDTTVQPLDFRDRDLWNDLAIDFNLMLEKMKEKEKV